VSERPRQSDSEGQVLTLPQASTPVVSEVAPHDSPTSPPVQAAVPSLPPALQDADPTPSEHSLVGPVPSEKTKKNWRKHTMTKDGVMRKKAVAIMAMRANGYTDDEIAKELHLKKATLHVYLHRAVRSGFLMNKEGSMFSDPADRLQYELANKAVDNLKDMLDSNEILHRGDKSVRMEATKLVAEGVLFKRFDQVKEAAQPVNVLQIKIEGTHGNIDVSAGGAPGYIDGETIGAGDDLE
jgi:predicted transcriptional regulator